MKAITTSIRKTYSLCPVCLKRVHARLIRQDENWYLKKSCPEHGSFHTVIWRGSAPDLKNWGSYRPPEEAEASMPDCPNDCGLCGKHLQNTCCVLVEVTHRCNLSCPVCFAESSEACSVPDRPLALLAQDFRALVHRGCRFIQLSGGEPTVRDDLPAVIRAAKDTGATSVQLNSNGLRLGADPAYTKSLAEAGLDFVFMQFDGTDDQPYRALRGRPLLKEKLEAIRVCGEAGIGVTLVPTVVPGINDHQLGEIIQLGISKTPVVRGVHFQPISYFGRYPVPPADTDRITLPEIIRLIETQTDGLIRAQDLAPSACDHPRCGFHGDFMILPDKLISLTPKASAPSSCCCKPDEEALRNRNFVARRWTRNLKLEQEAAKLSPVTGSLRKTAVDAADAVSEVSTESGNGMDFDTFLARIAANGFTVTSMAFQDAYNLDLERLRRCSLHVYEDGKLIPFCVKYLTGLFPVQ